MDELFGEDNYRLVAESDIDDLAKKGSEPFTLAPFKVDMWWAALRAYREGCPVSSPRLEEYFGKQCDHWAATHGYA